MLHQYTKQSYIIYTVTDKNLSSLVFSRDPQSVAYLAEVKKLTTSSDIILFLKTQFCWLSELWITRIYGLMFMERTSKDSGSNGRLHQEIQVVLVGIVTKSIGRN